MNKRLKLTYTLKEISALPTLSQGHADDLKAESATRRVWLSRMTIEDGQPYNNQVTVEWLNSRYEWKIYKQYQAK